MLSRRVSFIFIALVLVLTGVLHLGAMLLAILFSYFILTKFDFVKPGAKWVAIGLLILLIAAIGYALTHLIHATIHALPDIANRAVPAIVKWANEHQVKLPFTDLEGLKEKARDFAESQAHNLGAFADAARGATAEFIDVAIGVLVAIGIYLHPQLELAPPDGTPANNLYSLCCAEITRRFAAFYKSFAMVMNAQITISAINTALTAIFVLVMGLPHVVVAIGLTFLCGFLPVIGNLISNAIVVALGFLVSPTSGLWALVFLVVVHKLEYFLNSKIIGSKIHTSIWLTLLALMLGERLMGITGMVLAPVILHYIRIEASSVIVPTNSKSHVAT